MCVCGCVSCYSNIWQLTFHFWQLLFLKVKCIIIIITLLVWPPLQLRIWCWLESSQWLSTTLTASPWDTYHPRWDNTLVRSIVHKYKREYQTCILCIRCIRKVTFLSEMRDQLMTYKVKHYCCLEASGDSGRWIGQLPSRKSCYFPNTSNAR